MFYRIINITLIEKVKAIDAKRTEAEQAFLRLSRRVGASRTRYASSDTFGRRFAFIFNKDPDRAHWKRDRRGDYWLPKLSSKAGKDIDSQVHAIEANDGQRSQITKLFGVTGFFKAVGIRRIGEVFIVEFGHGWSFSTDGLDRISDVEVEKLVASARML